jgi:hypothetical protein
MRRLAPATPLDDILEADWQRDVVNLAKTLGWKTWHNYNARKSDFGWPDLFLARDRTIHLELKREKGKPTEQQKDWLRALIQAGAEAYIARPHDLDILGRILSSRHRDVAEPLLEQTRREVGG